MSEFERQPGNGAVQAGTGLREPRRGRTIRPREEIPFAEVTKETPLERFRRRRAVEQLREALAPHQPVVKQCVAERLCLHRPTAELARELHLTEQQVEEILARVRPWVHRYTTYFDPDWYWQEGGAPVLPVPAGDRAGR
jgi:hypothetical protein